MHDIRIGFFDSIGKVTLLNGDVENLDTVLAVDFRNLGPTRIFYGVALVKAQQLDQQTVQIIGSGPHHNLFRRHLDISEFTEHAGNGATQLQSACALGNFQQIPLPFAKDFAGNFCPGGKGERFDISPVANEVGDVLRVDLLRFFTIFNGASAFAPCFALLQFR